MLVNPRSASYPMCATCVNEVGSGAEIRLLSILLPPDDDVLDFAGLADFLAKVVWL